MTPLIDGPAGCSSSSSGDPGPVQKGLDLQVLPPEGPPPTQTPDRIVLSVEEGSLIR